LFFTNNFPFLIKGEIVLPVHHHLIGFGRISDVKEIYSHPQALGQCRQFWNKLKVKTRDTDSTSEAVQLVAQKQDKTIAAIGTKLASELYQAPIIKKNIADNRNNQTRFIVLGRKKRKKTGRDKTSFVFGTKNRSGALVEVLQVFKVLHINMTMLVPRPSKKRLGEYVFFADVEAHQRDRHLGAAFQALKEGRWVTFLRIFGSYPKAKKQNS
jgi:prephenate dehydratase